MKKIITLVLICALSSPLMANDDSQLQTLIKLEKQLNREAAAYNTIEIFRYISFGGIISGIALGSATMTMGTLGAFKNEKQEKDFTISTLVILSLSILLGVSTHAASYIKYHDTLMNSYDYYEYLEDNTEYLKGDVQ